MVILSDRVDFLHRTDMPGAKKLAVVEDWHNTLVGVV